MFLSKLRNRDESGFSLLEVLITAVIIGVLAAIAVPVVNGLRSQGDDAAVKSAVSTVVTEYQVLSATGGTAVAVNRALANPPAAVGSVQIGTDASNAAVNRAFGEIRALTTVLTDGDLSCAVVEQGGNYAKWTAAGGFTEPSTTALTCS